MLSAEHVAKSYGRDVRVLADVSMELAEPKIVGLFGATGSGKSTLIRILAGIEKPDRGSVQSGGRSLIDIPPAQRRIAYIPQDFALYPHLSVADNIAHPLLMQKVGRGERERRVGEIAERLGIASHLGQKPKDLSGGQKQRVALARGLVKDAQLYLLDDPLVGLDYKIRERLMEDLVALQRRSGAIFLYATSNSLEAMGIADEICVLAEGRVVDWAACEALYDRPTHLWTRSHLGYPRTNVFDCDLRVDGARVSCAFGDTRLTLETAEEARFAMAHSPTGYLTVRPESVMLGEAGDGAVALGTGTTAAVQNIGDATVVELEAELGAVQALVGRRGAVPAVGQRVPLSVSAEDVLVYGSSGVIIGGGHQHG